MPKSWGIHDAAIAKVANIKPRNQNGLVASLAIDSSETSHATVEEASMTRIFRLAFIVEAVSVKQIKAGQTSTVTTKRVRYPNEQNTANAAANKAVAARMY